MASRSGRLFSVTTFGESHGVAVGCIVDGCPPNLSLSIEDIQTQLDRRKPGQSSITTQRKEGDKAEILSGVLDGKTLGTPIAIMVRNADAKGKDYSHMRDVYRPSHADYTYDAKYGIRAYKGGGRASARETVGRVAAGAIAQKYLLDEFGIEILSYVEQVHTLRAEVDHNTLSRESIDANIVRCPSNSMAKKMEERIRQARKDGDSLGGIVGCIVRNVPAGWGEPVFDKLEADLGKAILSLPACKGFSVGSGFDGVTMTGSEHNDLFYSDADTIRTHSNNSGGIQGGISNGENIVLSAAFKPTPTITSEQQTVNSEGEKVTLAGKGRHDPCVLPRAVPIVDAVVALVLCDHALRQRGQCG